MAATRRGVTRWRSATTTQGKTAAALRLISAPETAAVTVRFFQDTGTRLWTWRTLRAWMRSVSVKKKHQEDMQKILNVSGCRWWSDELLFDCFSEATRLKVVQPDKTSHVRTRKRGLVKAPASRTITGIVMDLSGRRPGDEVSKSSGSDSETQNLQTSKPQRLRDSETQRLRDSKPPNLRDSETQRLRDSKPPNLRDSETQRLRDSEAQRLRGSEAQRLKDAKTERLKDSKTQRLRDSKTQRLRDSKTQRLKDSEAQRLRGSEAQRRKDSKMQRLKDSETQRLKDSKTQRLKDSEAQRLRGSEAQRLRPSIGSKSSFKFLITCIC
ncbi:hypothetical protein EYF80_052793 [Liparis tanakae]|uniref:Uncharacterized protein n=1 Tax=Liparis tanakae TaxID=230148 RepID=A0A4Z2F819_9TELE|nr:hypothetical protein EYF80_052793 [Liparis tanakae]